MSPVLLAGPEDVAQSEALKLVAVTLAPVVRPVYT
jgi:hypothetical protein